MLLILQFILQQVDRRLLVGDLLRGEQHVVIRQTHAQKRVGDDGLKLRHRLLLRRSGGAERGGDFPAFVNGLDQLDSRIPVLIRLVKPPGTGKLSIALGSVYLYWPVAVNCGIATARV